ncbi:hypothetical protein EBS02_06330, partial [bacterium]|nr:hypothetical protein [bacterium]
GDCLDILTLAFRWAMKAMTPVIILSDATLAQGSCQIALDDQKIIHEVLPYYEHQEGEIIAPYARNQHGARPWIIPGTSGAAHRIGGLEKQHRTGDISYDPDNHQFMNELRRAKLEHLAIELPEPLAVKKKRFIFITYGCPCGPVEEMLFQEKWDDITQIKLRTIYPLPSNFWNIVTDYDVVITIELAQEQLARYLRSFSQHPRILSYSQTNGYNINIKQFIAWFNALKEEDAYVGSSIC